MSWLTWRMWLDLAPGTWEKAFQAARAAGRHQHAEQGRPTHSGFAGEHCHRKQPGILVKDIPSVRGLSRRNH